MTGGGTVHAASPGDSMPHVQRRILHETLDVAARHRICLVIGAAAVSYTHLTLPTKRIV